MAKKEKLTTSQQDGVQYKRAKMWQIALSQLTGAGQMCFCMLMTYATYIGNVNYGILVAITGVIITASRIFDGITDPLCALIIERFNSKFGKIRIFMLLGWAFMALATTAMCNWGAGHLSGFAAAIQNADFAHLSICQHIDHDLDRQTERINERFAIGEHIHLPLGGHVVLEHLLLLFGERVGQSITCTHNFIQRFCVLAAALEAALAGANVAEV